MTCSRRSAAAGASLARAQKNRLNPGDARILERDGQGWKLLDSTGAEVGRLVKAFSPSEGSIFISARVHAIVHRKREDEEEEYRARKKCEQWEIVLPELIFK